LTGVPDDIFIMADGRYFIVDYKTAKYTGNRLQESELVNRSVIEFDGNIKELACLSCRHKLPISDQNPF